MATSERDTSQNEFKPWSCVVCRRRKVRCDRKDPCNNCTKNNIECHFPVTGRIPRRNRDPAAWKSPSQRQSELLSRLRRLETVVTEMAGQVDDNAQSRAFPLRRDQPPTIDPEQILASSSSLPAAAKPGSEFEEEFGRLVIDQDGALRVGNRFWSVFCGEVDNILQAIHDVTSIEEECYNTAIPEPWSQEASSSYSNQGFVFGSSAAASTPRHLYPLPSQMLFIWQTYIDRVHPFDRVLHIPTIDKIIRQFGGNFDGLGHPLESLLISISLAAIVTLREEDVILNFNIPKAQLLARYRVATEQALSRAGFLSTRDLTVIQAFVIYMSVFPHLGTKQLDWPLSGLLQRIAVRLGLHRDKPPTNSSAGEALLDGELRRRIWWQICFIDARNRDEHAPELSITPSMFDTALPTYNDDQDQGVGQGGLGSMHAGVPSSDARLSLIRCQLWQLSRAIGANPRPDGQTCLDIFQATKSAIERNHLQKLDLSLPFDAFIGTITTLFFTKVELVVYQQLQPSGSTGDKARLVSICLMLVEAVCRLQTEPQWVKWRWQFQGHVPWHALSVILSHLLHQDEWTEAQENSWILTRKMTDAVSCFMTDEPLWRSLFILLKRTEKHRQGKLSSQSSESFAPGENTTPLHDNANQEANNASTDQTLVTGGIDSSTTDMTGGNILDFDSLQTSEVSTSNTFMSTPSAGFLHQGASAPSEISYDFAENFLDWGSASVQGEVPPMDLDVFDETLWASPWDIIGM